MSQLMQMRQRIQAIHTIKKIAHAMRLISMSTHARMKHQEKPLETYRKKITELALKARSISQNHHNELLQPSDTKQKHALIILVGSQKGLCGSFNTMLMQRFNNYTKDHANFSLITVGKRATQLATAHYHTHIIAEYNTFGTHNLLAVAQEILNQITQAHKSYSSVHIISNSAATFFIQKPVVNQIIPAQMQEAAETKDPDYTVEQPAQEISDYLTRLYLLSQIQHALFQSLLAEHAARFISMDNSTRNAETLLEKMQLDYNKLRQANITRELTELSAFFLQ